MSQERTSVDSDPAEPKKGDKFILSKDKLIHVLDNTTVEESPSGVEHDIYHAVCGAESEAWGMGSGDWATARFIHSLEEGISEGAAECKKCNPTIVYEKFI